MPVRNFNFFWFKSQTLQEYNQDQCIKQTESLLQVTILKELPNLHGKTHDIAALLGGGAACGARLSGAQRE